MPARLIKSILPIFPHGLLVCSYLGGGGGPVSEFVLEDAYSKTIFQEIFKNAWPKVGADPLTTKKCLSDSNVAHEIGDDEE